MRPYYDEDGITIYNGDWAEMTGAIGVVDHVITDPPYDAQTHSGARSGNTKGGTVRCISSVLEIDFDPLDIEAAVPMMLRHARRWVVSFCSLEMLGTYRRVANESYVRGGFWRKPDGAPQFTGDRPGQPGEGLAILHNPGKKKWNGGGAHAYYEFGVEKKERVHPTQKPEGLMASIIQDFTDPGDLILDPFMGSGTTLRAAKDLGRRAVGIEIEERYCEIAAKRLRQRVLDFSERQA